jgi:ATP-dependent DNA ligase
MPVRTGFVEPMLLLRTEKLHEGPEWSVELKLDGYRALAIKTGGGLSFDHATTTAFPPIPSVVLVETERLNPAFLG